MISYVARCVQWTPQVLPADQTGSVLPGGPPSSRRRQHVCAVRLSEDVNFELWTVNFELWTPHLGAAWRLRVEIMKRSNNIVVLKHWRTPTHTHMLYGVACDVHVHYLFKEVPFLKAWQCRTGQAYCCGAPWRRGTIVNCYYYYLRYSYNTPSCNILFC